VDMEQEAAIKEGQVTLFGIMEGRR